MKKLKHWYLNLSFFYKILLLTVTVSMVSMVFIAVFTFRRVLSIEAQRGRNEILNGLIWAENYIDEDLSEFRLQCIKLSMDKDVYNELGKKTDSEKINAILLKKNLFDIKLSSISHSVFLLDFNQIVLSNMQSQKLEEAISEQLPDFLYGLNSTLKAYYYGKPIQYENEYLIPYVRWISPASDLAPVGILVANYSENRLQSMVDAGASRIDMKLENVMIVDGTTIISSKNKELINTEISDIVTMDGSDYSEGRYNGEQALFIRHRNPDKTDWQYIAVVTEKEMFSDSEGVIRAFILINLIGLIILVLSSYFVSLNISKPLKYLSVTMLEAGNKNLDLEIKTPEYDDEIGKMWQSLISMTKMLKESKEANRIAQEQNQRLKIDALKAQINPHFLYNTFGSIIYLIDSGKGYEATEMLSALSGLLHISYDKTREYIRVEEEVSLVRRYLEIQKIRYNEAFSFVFDLSMEIMPLYTIKIILQPVVENAISHGLKISHTNNGMIVITGIKEDNLLTFEVSDNFGTLTEQRREEVNAFLKSNTPAPEPIAGIGLKNVNDRIRFEFPGDERVGVRLELRNGKTVVRIVTGIKEHEDEKA